MMHKVTRPDDPEKLCLPCRCNPMMLVCTCKGSRKTGICSHIIAVNHRCGMINIQSELMHMQKKRKPGKGRVRQATGRRQMQPASSSDEASEIESDLEDYITDSDVDHPVDYQEEW